MYIYDSIINNQDKIIISDDKSKNKSNIIVIANNKIKLTIFNNTDLTCAARLIKTYAPNIGKEKKKKMIHIICFHLL